MSSLDKSKLNQANRAGSKGLSDARRVTSGSGGKPVSKPSPGQKGDKLPFDSSIWETARFDENDPPKGARLFKFTYDGVEGTIAFACRRRGFGMV